MRRVLRMLSLLTVAISLTHCGTDAVQNNEVAGKKQRSCADFSGIWQGPCVSTLEDGTEAGNNDTFMTIRQDDCRALRINNMAETVFGDIVEEGVVDISYSRNVVDWSDDRRALETQHKSVENIQNLDGTLKTTTTSTSVMRMDADKLVTQADVETTMAYEGGEGQPMTIRLTQACSYQRK